MRSSRQASAMTNGMDVVKLGPGLQSVARATVTPASSSRRAGAYGERVLNSAHGTSTATTSAVEQRGHVCFGQVGAVVGARGAQLGSQLYARPGPSCWRAGARPGRGPAGRQHPSALLLVEGSPFAEGVDRGRERRRGVQHLAADQVDVGVRVPVRHDVGAEEGGVLGDPAGDLQAAALVLDGQAVAGLHLERGRP
jgi:hypothetical protein